MKAKTLVCVIFLLVTLWSNAQTAVKLQAGCGYLEHFSVGAAFELNQRNAISVHYGSNFFYKPQDFSAYFLKYHRSFPSYAYRRVTPGIGAKIGYSIFTDTYYRWKIITAVPFFRFHYHVSSRFDFGAKGGLAISRIESVTRVSYGEIGKYKRYLPELNLSLYYSIAKNSHD